MDTPRREIRIPNLNPPLSHYTDAVQFGNLLFISGLAPLDAEGALVGGDDPAAQTRKIFESMQLILEEAGAAFSDVLRVTVYLTNIEDRPLINPVRKEFFGDTAGEHAGRSERAGRAGDAGGNRSRGRIARLSFTARNSRDIRASGL